MNNAIANTIEWANTSFPKVPQFTGTAIRTVRPRTEIISSTNNTYLEPYK
jgi:hypothetical protein